MNENKYLEDKIRSIIREELEALTKSQKASRMKREITLSGVIGIQGDSVVCDPFDTGNPSDEVYLKDVVSLDESPRLGAGYMEVIEGKPFAWTLEYDEVDVILEGTLEIVTETGKVRGGAGDTIFIPKGSSIQFTCPEGGKTRFVYVTYPADWQEG